METVISFLSSDFMIIVLAFILLAILLWLYNVNNDKSSSASLLDLITINGKLNERKLTRFGTWIVSTWGFVYLISKGTLSEWYFIGYMGAWVANALIGKAIGSKSEKEGE